MDANDFIPLVALGGGCLVAIVAIVFSAVTGWAKSRDRERSRREVAAYIAEGTLTPEDGERILKAGPKNIC